MASRSLSSGVPRPVASSKPIIAARSGLPASRSSSTTWYSSSPRCLISPSNAVAMLVCLSITRLRSWSCGSEATAETSAEVSFRDSSFRAEFVFPSPAPSFVPPDVALVMSAMAFLYSPSAFSTSSATTGNCASPFSRQNASSAASRSYDFFPAAPAGPSPLMSTRFRRIASTSCTSGAYVHSCFTIEGTSKLRSNSTNSGRSVRSFIGETSVANSEPFPLKWSRKRRSSDRAIISAAPPFGHRITGAFPSVAHAASNPSTMCSISNSTALSDEPGSLSVTYDARRPSEKRSGARETKSRY
mmetsp:Transcript_6128/g.24834  ORF Transcript_6128/g.24834 Transcript_6128/m.24834 type:complete len:301 (+) Transcript_6128:825-1727(+)